MANWKHYIRVKVKLPYITQICTLGHIEPIIEIPMDAVWFADDAYRWKADIYYGDYRILFTGKVSVNRRKGYYWNCTTYKVDANATCNGIYPMNEQYKVKVISFS